MNNIEVPVDEEIDFGTYEKPTIEYHRTDIHDHTPRRYRRN